MESNWLFISIPKNASQSIIAEKPEYKIYNHRTAQAIKDMGITDKLFCITRHPADRLVSWFFFAQQQGRGAIYKTSFREWINKGCPQHWVDEPHNIDNPLEQHEFICDANGNIIVDKIMKLENLDNQFLSSLGINVRHANQGQHKLYTEYYDESLYKKIKSMFHKDFELFGYV